MNAVPRFKIRLVHTPKPVHAVTAATSALALAFTSAVFTPAAASAHVPPSHPVPQAVETPAPPAGSSENPYRFDPDDPFYLPPAPSGLPQQPGSLIRTQTAALPIDGSALGTAHATKLLYTSTDVNGERAAVSGMLLEPTKAWDGAGPRPTVVFAPGSRGMGDACAPSRNGHYFAGYDPTTGAVGINYDSTGFYRALARGYRVVVTDYIGLGTPGVHGYSLHPEEGNAVLDAARAGLTAAA